MKQILQNLSNGETILEEVPVPLVKRGQVLIQTTKSLVSLGTERMLVEFGQANLIQKARQQPEKVKMVLDKIKTDGLMPTLETVFNKLNQPLPLGYCNVGKIVKVGEGVSEFKVGDRVASNGNHAEFVAVAKNLVTHIPDQVTDEEATFTVIGSIGLQGIRLLNPTLGETIVVIGLGLIGLITAELLVANGCTVIGIDLDSEKLKIASVKGIIGLNPRDGVDVVKFVESYTNGVGADGIIITASAKTNDIISQAARMSRKRGRIILVGVIGLEMNRSEFYEKELTFQVSCSYGPGRYDENYEQRGQDYPIGFVRWTEQRNFQTILQMIANGRIDVKPLITEVVPLSDYKNIYGEIAQSRSIASVITYPESQGIPSSSVTVTSKSFQGKKGVFGIIGAGNYAKMTMLPAMKGADIKYIASAGGVNSTALAKQFGIAKSTTDHQEMLKDTEVDTVIITTRHDLHAQMAVEALAAGKNVFIEKPLALNIEQLELLIAAQDQHNQAVNVGFNRRFSPHAEKIKSLMDSKAPKNIIATMNAGFIPKDVWVHNLETGGGRIIGEACHFIDLITFFTGSKVKSVCMSGLGTNPEENTDNACILLKYENGDQGVINYFSNGNKAYSKERVEVYSQEKVMVLDNFRVLKGYGTKGFSSLKTKLDKGHKKQFQLLMERAKSGGAALIPFEELVNTTKASFAAVESLKTKQWVEIG